MAKRQFCVQASYRGHQGGQVILSAPRSPRGAGPGPQLGLWYPCAPLSSELEERTSSSWFTREPRKQQWGQDTDKVVVWHGIQLQVFAPLWVLLFPVHLRSLLTRAMSFFPLPSWEVLIGSEINITSHVSWEYPDWSWSHCFSCHRGHCCLVTKLCTLSRSGTQSCLTLCDPVDYSPPGSSVHGISQARILGGLQFLSSGDLPNPGMEPASPAWQADSLPLSPQGSPIEYIRDANVCVVPRVNVYEAAQSLRWQSAAS